MNNFVFSQDPLLYQNIGQAMRTQPEYDPRQQFDMALAQYNQMQQALNNKQNGQQDTGVKDYLGELDEILQDLDESVKNKLNDNEEFVEINTQIQTMIQTEIMKGVKWKINSNPEAVSKIDNLKTIIKNVKKEQIAEEKKNMLELNDYLNHYSSMSFDDYKRIKSQTQNVE
jgi:uncharacterized UPF0160 family protein